MAAPESTKFQVNYKLADGTLINIYATNQAELESSLTSLSDLSTLITTTGTTLGATPQSFNGAGAVSYAKKALGATSVATDTGGDTVTDKFGSVYTYNRADAPDCVNGKMIHKSGVKQDGTPFWGWYDPAAGPRPVRMGPGYVKVKSIHPDSVSKFKK
jgi:hypothetical protein